MEALQAARAKAETLMKSIGAEIGKAIMVRDWEVQPYDPMMEMKSNVRLRAADAMHDIQAEIERSHDLLKDIAHVRADDGSGSQTSGE